MSKKIAVKQWSHRFHILDVSSNGQCIVQRGTNFANNSERITLNSHLLHTEIQSQMNGVRACQSLRCKAVGMYVVGTDCDPKNLPKLSLITIPAQDNMEFALEAASKFTFNIVPSEGL